MILNTRVAPAPPQFNVDGSVGEPKIFFRTDPSNIELRGCRGIRERTGLTGSRLAQLEYFDNTFHVRSPGCVRLLAQRSPKVDLVTQRPPHTTTALGHPSKGQPPQLKSQRT